MGGIPSDAVSIQAQRIAAPTQPQVVLERPSLLRRLDESLSVRLASLVADAGFGKSTTLAAWTSGRRSCWYTLGPDDVELAVLTKGLVSSLRLRVPALPPDITGLAGADRGPKAGVSETMRSQAWGSILSDALQEHLDQDLILVLDDLHEIEGSEAAIAFVETLCRQAPPQLHVILASRRELPFAIERLRGQGQVLEITAQELAFTIEEVAQLLALYLGPDSGGHADSLYRLSRGWPAAVRLAIESLRGITTGQRAATFERFSTPKSSLIGYLAEEVLSREPDRVTEFLRRVACFDYFTADLCEFLGMTDASQMIALLEKRGLFLEPHVKELGWLGVGSLVRELVREQWPIPEDEARELHARAVDWFESQGHPEEALRSLIHIGDVEGLEGFLHRHGETILTEGAPDMLLRAIELLPPPLDPELLQLVGQAKQIKGDWEEALACFEEIASVSEVLTPGIAWRMGLIQHLRGDPAAAIAAYERAELDGKDPGQEALLLAWKGSAHWLLGQIDQCRSCATEAFDAATSANEPRALAAAHTALALLAALTGDRRANDAHYLRALEAAERARDTLQIIRIRTNRGSQFIEEGSYEEALAELAIAIRLADLAGYAAFHALALTNRGEVLERLGRFEEATVDLEMAKAIYQRIGSLSVVYALHKLGDIYRERGDFSLARAGYEEGVEVAQSSGDVQGLVPSLAGLARVLAKDDPPLARATADRAVSFGSGMGYVQALLASAWVSLLGGDRDAARAATEAAAAEARARRDRPGLAESLELLALSAEVPSLETHRLEEAVAAWKDIGDPVGGARAELTLAGLVGGSAGRALAHQAKGRLQEIGARGTLANTTALVASLSPENDPPVAIQSLGNFGVFRRGTAVSHAEWQSKKARDLLKILVARRGLTTPRDYVIEALWPEDDPIKLANRLSVALTTVRNVLDPDREFDAEHFVGGDKSALRLNLENMRIDVNDFLQESSAALDLRKQGRRGDAGPRLAQAERIYLGDFLEEDAYEEWAIPLREEARAAYISVVRALAEDSAAEQDFDSATRFCLRLLERDPYDEQAHLLLVSIHNDSRRHGEARRRYRSYCSRMEEIGVEAAPFPRSPSLSRL